MNYNTSIATGGVGGGIGDQLAKLRAPRTSGFMGSLFNASPYQKQQLTPQASAEMDRHFQDTNRAARWNAANDLERKFTTADQQARMGQLNAASNAGLNFFGNALGLQDQQLGLGMNNLGWMQSLFGGGLW